MRGPFPLLSSILMSSSSTTKPRVTSWTKLSKAWCKDLLHETSFSQHPQPPPPSAITAAMTRTLPLLEDTTSLPFVCRYRVDVISPLQSEHVHKLCEYRQAYEALGNLRNRILDHLDNQQPEDNKLRQRVETCKSKTELEDLHAPFKPPSKGSLEERIQKQHPGLVQAVDAFWNCQDKNQASRLMYKLKPKEAAVTLLANRIASDVDVTDVLMDYVRKWCRVKVTQAKASKTTSTKTSSANNKAAPPKRSKSDAETYRHYFNLDQPLTRLRDHQVLAIRRGVDQKLLQLSYDVDADRAESAMYRSLSHSRNMQNGAMRQFYNEAIHDAFTRLLRKRCTTRLWKQKLTMAEERSIQVFCQNLQTALWAEPLHPPRAVLAFDPGFQAGIKCALLDAHGGLLPKQDLHHHDEGEKKNNNKNLKEGEDVALYTIQHVGRQDQAIQQIRKLLEAMQQHDQTQAAAAAQPVTVAMGNGHGTHQAQTLLHQAAAAASSSSAKKAFFSPIPIKMHLVNEAGASVWSITPSATSTIPHHPPSALAAISIGRRLQNPLEELVKVPPPSLGLGMYQHDVSEKILQEKLHLASVDAVAEVGVDVNGCSLELLEKVPGLSSALCRGIMEKRPFRSREELQKKVAGMGPKRFQQCAAFLRIPQEAGGGEALDGTMCHPESYALAKDLLQWLKWKLDDASSVLDPADISSKNQEEQEGQTVYRVPSRKDLKSKYSTIVEKAAKRHEVPPERVLLVMEHLATSILCPDPRLAPPEAHGNKATHGVSASASASASAAHGSNKDWTKDCKPLAHNLASSMQELQNACPVRNVQATVRNVCDFGVFCDFGGERDGLVHRSKLGSRVKMEGLRVGQVLGVDVLGVDLERGKVSLSVAGLGLPKEETSGGGSGERRKKRGLPSTRDERKPLKSTSNTSRKRPRVQKR